MISCIDLSQIFIENDLTLFAGVPDSTFKGWMTFLETRHNKKMNQILAANECEAIAVAAGYHLATGKIAVVYMQNSGQGKTVNPLTSLCDSQVYSIPVILMIGWRGEPEKTDEPQHRKMGRIMIPLLETLEIPFRVLPDTFQDAKRVVASIKKIADEENKPVALLIKRGIIESYPQGEICETMLEMNREEALQIIIDNLDGSEAIVSTTGKTSRELFEYRIKRNEKPMDFYTVGSMGCAMSIAFGLSLEKPEKEVFVFDGDGAVIMQMGSLATIGHYRPNNFKHILFDNRAHDSTGGQATVSGTMDFEKIAIGCGYRGAMTVQTKDDLEGALQKLKSERGPYMLIISVRKGSRRDLGRPTTTPLENKKNFMKALKVN